MYYVHFELLCLCILHSIILHCKMYFLIFFQPLAGHFLIGYQIKFVKKDLTAVCNPISVEI